MSAIDWGKVVKPRSAEDLKADSYAVIARKRFERESAGITLNGMQIDTGRDSQGLITGAALSALLDDTYQCNWKTPSGFVVLDAATLKSVAQTVRAYVQACFDREAALQLLVDKGTYQDYLLEKGWPSGEIS